MIFTIAPVGFVFVQGRIPHSGHFHQENKKTAAATNNTHSTTFSQHWWSLYSVLHRQHSLGFHWIFNMHMHTPAVHRTPFSVSSTGLDTVPSTHRLHIWGTMLLFVQCMTSAV